jgi:hypothetical protein
MARLITMADSSGPSFSATFYLNDQDVVSPIGLVLNSGDKATASGEGDWL